MQEAYPFFIALSVLGFWLGTAYVYICINNKAKERYFVFSAILWYAMAILTIVGMLLHSEKTIVFALFVPVSLCCLLATSNILLKYKRCDLEISAKYVSYTRVTHRGVSRFAPRFTFRYNGMNYEADSFIYYSKGKFNHLFEEGSTYDVFIDPQNPKYCTDKRCFPITAVIGTVAWATMAVVSVVIVVLL